VSLPGFDNSAMDGYAARAADVGDLLLPADGRTVVIGTRPPAAARRSTPN